MTGLTLTGVDGSSWELLDRLSPVHLLSGMGGLHLAPASNRWATTARRSGRRWKDVVNDARQFTMTVRVGDAEPPYRVGDDWRALDSQFWRALATDSQATLTFNGQRSLRFRLDDDNEHDFPKDPALLGKAAYSIACIADRPEWLGEEQTTSVSFAPVAGDSYYPVSQGPPFTISAPTLGQYVVINNPGDLPTYPVWRIVGPATTATVGVGDRTITIPFSLQAGQQVIIDTESQTIIDGTGVNLWSKMGSTPVDFAPIPPGGDIPVAVGIEDGGTTSLVAVTVTARYRRAW